jgi:DNA-binding transcriptional LysR family regulator
MDFDQLTTFLEITRLGNFSRAADKVFRSQSAVSAQVRQLEQDYGARLLDRSGKKVQLTPAGRVLAEYATRLVALRGESLRAVADADATPRGVLAIGANEATCLYVLPRAFTRYHSHYPDVQISIYRNFSRKVLEKLQDGEIDIGVITLPVKAPNVVVERIFHDRLVLMTSATHPLAGYESVSVHQLIEHPLILPQSGSTRRMLDKTLRPYGPQLRIVMELPSVAMIKAFVASGLGVSFISESFAIREQAAGELRLIPLSDSLMTRELGLVYQRDRTLPRSAVAFKDLVRTMMPCHALPPVDSEGSLALSEG